MKLFVVFAQRRQRYNGEYAPEALAVMTEYDEEDNPQYLQDEIQKAERTGEFSNVKLLTFNVNGAKIAEILNAPPPPMDAELVQ